MTVILLNVCQFKDGLHTDCSDIDGYDTDGCDTDGSDTDYYNNEYVSVQEWVEY